MDENWWYEKYNRNPKGRKTTDCVFRAISTALQIPYEQVVMEMAEMQCRTGYDAHENVLINRYLKSKGWECRKQPRKSDGTKYTGKEFCQALLDQLIDVPHGTRIVCNIGGHHTSCIIDYKVWDTWDCTYKCVGKYWTKK